MSSNKVIIHQDTIDSDVEEPSTSSSSSSESDSPEPPKNDPKNDPKKEKPDQPLQDHPPKELDSNSPVNPINDTTNDPKNDPKKEKLDEPLQDHLPKEPDPNSLTSPPSSQKRRRTSLSSDLSKLVLQVTDLSPKNPSDKSTLPLTARIKNFMEGTSTFHAHQSLRLTKGNDLDILTALPPDTSLTHWIKVNVAEFYNSILALCDLLQPYCTPATCPQMTAGENCSFLWAEGEYRHNPTALPACDYLRRLMEWADTMIQNEQVFPSDDSQAPAGFTNTCDILCRRLLRAPMHFYHHHYELLKEKGENETLDRLTLRYCVFALKFNLFKSKDRVLPILEILQQKLPQKFKLLLSDLPMQVSK